MGLPSGTFSEADSAQLEVTFSGEFFSQSGSDWGGTSGLYLVLKCTINNGSTDIAVGYIKNSADSLTLIADYPGGNAAWTVAMTDYTHSLSGPSTIGVTNCRITCKLIAR